MSVFLTILEAGKSKIKIRCLVRALFLIDDNLLCIHMAEEMEEQK
jgi:hypothetical protein